MKPTRRLGLLACVTALSATLQSVMAGSLPLIDGSHEILLDMDRDGRMDRAVVTREAGSALVDLSIYLDAGDGTTDLSRPPTALKKGLTSELITGLESGDGGVLVVTYGCGGCSNDYETTLTIAWREGDFLVAAFAYAWDTRQGIGGCEIDFLAGTAFVSEGLDEVKRPVEGKFAPMTLADWSDDKGIEVCGL